MELTVFFNIGSQVSYQLHKLADAKGPDAVRFERLANSVEEFTYCLLDGLKIDPVWCKYFGDRCLDDFIDDAIGYEQKKVMLNDNSICFSQKGLRHLMSCNGVRGVFFTLVVHGRVTKNVTQSDNN